MQVVVVGGRVGIQLERRAGLRLTFSGELAIDSSVKSSTAPPTPMAKISAPWLWTRAWRFRWDDGA